MYEPTRPHGHEDCSCALLRQDKCILPLCGNTPLRAYVTLSRWIVLPAGIGHPFILVVVVHYFGMGLTWSECGEGRGDSGGVSCTQNNHMLTTVPRASLAWVSHSFEGFVAPCTPHPRLSALGIKMACV